MKTEEQWEKIREKNRLSREKSRAKNVEKKRLYKLLDEREEKKYNTERVSNPNPEKNLTIKKYAKASDSKKHVSLMKKYGISLDTFNNMYEIQNGCCAICGKHENEFLKPLAVDHNHMTGQIRCLLCTKCNMGLGYFEDNSSLLQKANNYINKFNEDK